MPDEPNHQPETPDLGPALPQRITFEWFRYRFGSAFNESGDREIGDVAYLESARVLAPVQGEAISGQVVAWNMNWHNEQDGRRYVLLRTTEGFVAASADVNPPCHHVREVQVRAVPLEDAAHRQEVGWEIWAPDENGHWQPVAGQHLELRTAPASVWRKEIEQTVLPGLEREIQTTMKQWTDWRLLRAEFEHARPLSEAPKTGIAPSAPEAAFSQAISPLAHPLRPDAWLPEHGEAWKQFQRVSPTEAERARARKAVQTVEKILDEPDVRHRLQAQRCRAHDAGAKIASLLTSIEKSLEQLRRHQTQATALVVALRQQGDQPVTLQQTKVVASRHLFPPQPPAEKHRATVASNLSTKPKIGLL